ncbi:ABC transporter permease [Methanohalobium sp.]|uniref:ABC transporter permease n=1 Tax=Methanohalobium sp. TaxID=2837493 RepID=UPI0025D1B768|nr:ABC transporter permease [Methanohalobium sp.]
MAFKIAVGSISSSKLRSMLTTLGIVIGVAAVIANVSLGASFSQFFEDEIGASGDNFIVIFSNDVNVFSDNQFDLLRNTPGIVGASPVIQKPATVEYGSSERSIEMFGTTEGYERVGNINLESGNFLSDNDRYVAVLGYEIANGKFDRDISNRNSIDITFRRNDGTERTETFRVKGITEDRDPSFVGGGPNPEERIFIPISTMQDMLNREDYGGFALTASSLENIREISDDVDKRLARSLGVPERQLDNEDVKPYTIFNQAEILDQVGQISAGLSALLISVALISLVVGSIGIMNIMLVTVTERTREIGLMKAVGYTYYDVLILFIVESVVIGLFGGIIGTIMGLLGAYGANTFLDLPNVFPVELIIIGFGVAVLVGVIAGVYPASKAAKMDPVEALRYE